MPMAYGAFDGWGHLAAIHAQSPLQVLDVSV